MNLDERVEHLEQRPVPVGAKRILILLAFVLALFAAAFVYSDVQRADDLQQGCERTNTTREALVAVWRQAAATQLKSVSDLPPGNSERAAIEEYAAVLRSRARGLVDSVDDVAVKHGSPTVRCDAAYPSPFGL